jgi:tellurite resistance protein TehA-like permease
MISTFEYITILLSIILGMGITGLVSGVASIVTRWERVSLYFPHTILVVLLFIIHVQEWWAIFEMRTYTEWRLPVFLFISLYPINLYILSRILFPLRWSMRNTDLKEFYLHQYKRIFLLLLILVVLAVLDNIWIAGYAWSDQFFQLASACCDQKKYQ